MGYHLAPMLTIVLLFLSNIFMTLAWYGHLRFKNVPLWQAMLASWLLAGFEYIFQVPANRWGSAVFSVGQLKTIQVVIELAVFSVFVRLYMKQALTWNYYVGFVFLFLGAGFIFRKW